MAVRIHTKSKCQVEITSHSEFESDSEPGTKHELNYTSVYNFFVFDAAVCCSVVPNLALCDLARLSILCS